MLVFCLRAIIAAQSCNRLKKISRLLTVNVGSRLEMKGYAHGIRRADIGFSSSWHW